MSEQMTSQEIYTELKEMGEKVDRIFEMLKPVLIEADYLTKTNGLNENTISRNNKVDKFNMVGKRRLLMTLESVPVVKNRKRKGAK